jgi:REP element-mobilizing transposase RayT
MTKKHHPTRRLQLDIFEQKPKPGPKPKKPRHVFGGAYLKSYNPKTARPLDGKKALHVVLKSSQAKGDKSFKAKTNEAPIWDIVKNHADRLGIKIYEYANGGDHLHILLRARHRSEYNAFIRTISGLIARLVGKSERGSPLKRKRFWDARPFSRIVSFAKREFQTAKTYFLRNALEAIGWMPYVPRTQKLSPQLREWLNWGALSSS